MSQALNTVNNLLFKPLKFFLCFFNQSTKIFAHFANLSARIYLFQVFFKSGWLKLTSWQSTVYLFQYEFKVPLMDPVLAAYFGTAAELIFPSILLLGLFSRVSALGFFIFNLISVYAYPFLWTPAGLVGFKDHVIWGIVNQPYFLLRTWKNIFRSFDSKIHLPKILLLI